MSSAAYDKNQNRIVNYDLLRILAAFSVVMLHSAAQFWYDLPVTGMEWKIVNAYDACFRFGVPVFVMLSGAIFLNPDRELDMKRLYRHNILRLVVIYLLWGAVYGLLDCWRFGFANLTWKQIAKEMASGRYHMWYIPMLVGIYVLLPILRSWILRADRGNIRYFLMLFVILQILRTTASCFVVNSELLHFLSLGEIQMAGSYLGYFVLGYYIAHVGIPQKYHKYFYVAAVPAALLNILISDIHTARDGSPNGAIYDSFGLFTFVIVMAIFLFFIERLKTCRWSVRSAAVITEVSKATLGIYLMHIGVIEVLQPLGIHSAMIPVAAGVPLLALLTFFLCYVFSALLRRIRLVGRYIC